ncbi:MAG: polyphosphate polymerase domain-containing protein [Bauldia sp.]|nr:polyphosphate polymerase domain-containing protein [Bauldia sp.]MCW5717440.1 polyphosphate polymerase domain-containing protein [Bauldia sp.]
MMELDLDRFAGIGLAELDERAKLHERTDQKYVVPASALDAALAELADDFDVLDIDGRRSFSYDSVYFDGPGLPSFVHHRQGRRLRFKVRIRNYVDAGAAFLEVKLKGKRRATVKRRLALGPSGELDASGVAFIEGVYAALYARDFDTALAPSVRVRYHRTTLVARRGGERITVDRDVAFEGDAGQIAIDGGVAIVETKSHGGRGLADQVLRRLQQRPVAHCSKYCVGVSALGIADRDGPFRPAMTLLGVRG